MWHVDGVSTWLYLTAVVSRYRDFAVVTHTEEETVKFLLMNGQRYRMCIEPGAGDAFCSSTYCESKVIRISLVQVPQTFCLDKCKVQISEIQLLVATLVRSSALGTPLVYGLRGHGVLSTCMCCIDLLKLVFKPCEALFKRMSCHGVGDRTDI